MKTLIAFVLSSAFAVASLAGIVSPRAPTDTAKRANERRVITLAAGESLSVIWPGDSLAYDVPIGKTARVELVVHLEER